MADEPTLRDDILPVVDEMRQIPDDLGLRRYSLTMRMRRWSGGKPGLGSPTDTDLEILPRPKVRVMTTKEIAQSAGTYRMGDFKVEKITPNFISDTERHGFKPSDLDVEADEDQEDVVAVLVGDEGEIECTVVEYHFDLPFNYWMVLRERRQASETK